MILDDLANEFDPTRRASARSTRRRSCRSPSATTRGNEINRAYTDRWGTYNALVPSTFRINAPMPSGVSPNMLHVCLNSPTREDPATRHTSSPTRTSTGSTRSSATRCSSCRARRPTSTRRCCRSRPSPAPAVRRSTAITRRHADHLLGREQQLHTGPLSVRRRRPHADDHLGRHHRVPNPAVAARRRPIPYWSSATSVSARRAGNGDAQRRRAAPTAPGATRRSPSRVRRGCDDRPARRHARRQRPKTVHAVTVVVGADPARVHRSRARARPSRPSSTIRRRAPATSSWCRRAPTTSCS